MIEKTTDQCEECDRPLLDRFAKQRGVCADCLHDTEKLEK